MKIDLVTMKFACYTLWFYTMNHGKLHLKGCNHEVCSMNHKKTTFRRCNFEILHDESLWKNNTLCGKMGQKYD